MITLLSHAPWFHRRPSSEKGYTQNHKENSKLLREHASKHGKRCLPLTIRDVKWITLVSAKTNGKRHCPFKYKSRPYLMKKSQTFTKAPQHPPSHLHSEYKPTLLLLRTWPLLICQPQVHISWRDEALTWSCQNSADVGQSEHHGEESTEIHLDWLKGGWKSSNGDRPPLFMLFGEWSELTRSFGVEDKMSVAWLFYKQNLEAFGSLSGRRHTQKLISSSSCMLRQPLTSGAFSWPSLPPACILRIQRRLIGFMLVNWLVSCFMPAREGFRASRHMTHHTCNELASAYHAYTYSSKDVKPSSSTILQCLLYR